MTKAEIQGVSRFKLVLCAHAHHNKSIYRVL